jgi:hypothetical protein
MSTQILALSDGVATGLILAVGAGGSFALVLGITLFGFRRTDRRATRRARWIVGANSKRDAYPPQPYSADEPHSHQPFSRAFEISRHEHAHGGTNGSRPPGSTGTNMPTAPWPGPADDDD